ncbi:glycerophosphodiester phosphodiesterase family protein [Cellulomonas hominis]
MPRTPHDAPTPSYGAEAGVLAIAHRGGSALGAENTLEACERSLALGFGYLETDARMTADGVWVAFHDRTLQRVTGMRGRVADVTWADLRGLRVHGTALVPRLEDLLGAWPDVRWIVDVKQPSALESLARLLRQPGTAHRVCLSGTWDSRLDQARREVGPTVSTAAGWRSMATLLAGGAVDPRGAEFVHVPLRLVGRWLPTPVLVRRAHDAGLRMLVWGVEAAGDIHRLLDDGVDGVITDRPDTLREVLVARSAWRSRHVTIPGAARPRDITAAVREPGRALGPVS